MEAKPEELWINAGFAYDVEGNGKTVARGGYSIAYERNFGNVTFNVIQNPPNYEVVALTDGGNTPLVRWVLRRIPPDRSPARVEL